MTVEEYIDKFGDKGVENIRKFDWPMGSSWFWCDTACPACGEIARLRQANDLTIHCTACDYINSRETFVIDGIQAAGRAMQRMAGAE